MPTDTPAGRRARARPDASNVEIPDASACVVCGAPADGVHAPTRDPVCARCGRASLLAATDDDPDHEQGAVAAEPGRESA
jgi:hypothetical protein